MREHPTPSFHSTRFPLLDDLAMEGVHCRRIKFGKAKKRIPKKLQSGGLPTVPADEIQDNIHGCDVSLGGQGKVVLELVRNPGLSQRFLGEV